jgi:protein SFI1
MIKCVNTFYPLVQLTTADALSAWRQTAHRSRSLRLVADALIRRWRGRTVAGALDGWREYAARRRQLRAAAELLSGRLSKSTLAKALSEWAAEARKQRRARRLLARVLMRSSALAFYGWQ